jgi:hypothetical protein
MRSVIPRRTISSASSRWLQWLIGRPELFGCSQASATIWHTCSGLRRGCTPGRGASARRLAALTSSSGNPRQATHRRRHNPTASTSIGRRRATSALLYPRAAKSTTRARRANACPVRCARTNASSSNRSLTLAQHNFRRSRSWHAALRSARCLILTGRPHPPVVLRLPVLGVVGLRGPTALARGRCETRSPRVPIAGPDRRVAAAGWISAVRLRCDAGRRAELGIGRRSKSAFVSRTMR